MTDRGPLSADGGVARGLVRPGAALVVVDMQRVFAEPSSAWATPGFGRAEAGTVRLCAAFPAHRTIFTRFVPGVLPAGAWADYYAAWPFALEERDSAIWDLVPAFASSAGPTIDCPTFSKWGPALRDRLGDADQVVLAGVSTDCCVIATALALADAGIRVVVASDATWGLSPADHERALAAMGLFAPHITVASVDEILADAARAPAQPAP